MPVWFKKEKLMAELGLHCISTRLTKNYAWELNFLTLIRKFSDGIILFNFIIDADFYRGDHNPQFGFKLMFLNLMLIEFRVYNINHVDLETTKEFTVECPKCKNPLSVRKEI